MTLYARKSLGSSLATPTDARVTDASNLSVQPEKLWVLRDLVLGSSKLWVLGLGHPEKLWVLRNYGVLRKARGLGQAGWRF